MRRRLAQENLLGIGAILLLFAAVGCSSYRQIAPPDAGRAFRPGTAMRVTLESGERFRVDGVSVSEDSVRGLRDGRPYAVARDSVVAYEASRINPVKSVVYLTLGVALFAGFVALMRSIDGGPS